MNRVTNIIITQGVLKKAWSCRPIEALMIPAKV